MPLNHIGLNTLDLERLHDFYTAALKPLGYVKQMEFMDGNVRGYGKPRCAPDFWLTGMKKPEGSETPQTTGFLHLAFTARTRNEVRAFHAAALAAGGKCNGPPGPRPQYFFTYYGAFVIDPEGRNIEAVCLKPGFWAEEWSWGVYGALLATTVGSVGYCFGLF